MVNILRKGWEIMFARYPRILVIMPIIFILPLRTLQNEPVGCYLKQKKEKYSPSIESRVPSSKADREKYCIVDINYLKLDIFYCEDRGDTFIKRDCLTCGKKNSIPVCPGPRKGDDPRLHLTCSDCLKYTNSCHNAGKMICPDPDKSYAYEMKCNCTDGFTGDFCENKLTEVYRKCRCSGNYSRESLPPPCYESSASKCYMELPDRHMLCICESTEDEKPDDLPNCNNLTADIFQKPSEYVTVEMIKNRTNIEPSVYDISEMKKNRQHFENENPSTAENRACKGYTWDIYLSLITLFVHISYG